MVFPEQNEPCASDPLSIPPMIFIPQVTLPKPRAYSLTPKFIAPLDAAKAVTQSRLLKALADPTRLRILSLLNRHEGEVCVCEIVESFSLEQPTISHHLRILRDAGIVDYDRKGLWAYYYIRRDVLSHAREIIGALVQ
jgi:ArsR family transcriptional regulator